jgi:hypothetical protein
MAFEIMTMRWKRERDDGFWKEGVEGMGVHCVGTCATAR